eukprot:743039-Hanusia_phi.AAC.1
MSMIRIGVCPRSVTVFGFDGEVCEEGMTGAVSEEWSVRRQTARNLIIGSCRLPAEPGRQAGAAASCWLSADATRRTQGVV